MSIRLSHGFIAVLSGVYYVLHDGENNTVKTYLADTPPATMNEFVEGYVAGLKARDLQARAA